MIEIDLYWCTFGFGIGLMGGALIGFILSEIVG